MEMLLVLNMKVVASDVVCDVACCMKEMNKYFTHNYHSGRQHPHNGGSCAGRVRYEDSR